MLGWHQVAIDLMPVALPEFRPVHRIVEHECLLQAFNYLPDR